MKYIAILLAFIAGFKHLECVRPVFVTSPMIYNFNSRKFVANSQLMKTTKKFAVLSRNVFSGGENEISFPLTATSKSFPHFIAGIVAGALECIVGHPLDTYRVVSMSSAKGTGNSWRSFISACTSWHGISGLYRGASSEVLSSAVAGSFLFGFNDVIKRVFGKTCDDEDIESVDSKLIGAAAITGFMDGVICKPFELIKSRQQFVPEFMQLSTWDCCKSVYKENGVAGFFRGWLPTVLRETGGNVAFFVAYHQTKIWLHRGQRQQPRWSNSTIALLSGAAAGLAYVAVSQPLELCSIVMQTDHPYWAPATAVVPSVPVFAYSSMRDCIRQIVSNNGYAGLYKGTIPTLIRALPTYGAAIWGYELTLNAIHRIQSAHQSRARHKEKRRVVLPVD